MIEGASTIEGNPIAAGDVVIIPAGMQHGGDEVLIGEADGDALVLLSVITPPRWEYGAEDVDADKAAT